MSKKILLADDSVTIRRIVELTFGDTEFRVESVGSGAEALKRFESMHPDVVVADVSMPGPNGYEVCRNIKLSAHPCPVLLLTGTFEHYDEEAAAECAADAYLTKPFDADSLIRMIELLASTPLAMIETAPGAEPIEAEIELDVESDGFDAGLPEPPAPVLASDPDHSELETMIAAEQSGDAVELADEVEAAPEVDLIVQEVLRLLSDEVVRDIAKKVVPEIAERIVRERIRELESEDS